MGNTQSGNSTKKKNNATAKWYEYEYTKCVSNGTGSMRCVAMRGNSNSNRGINNKNKNNKNESFVELRRHGRRGILASL